MVSANGNGVELGREFCAEFKGINYQAHRRRGRVDVFLLRDVFLQDVILERAGNFFPVGALLFCHHQIHGPQNRRGRIDRHGNSGLLQINAVEENFHVFQRINGDAALAYFAFTRRMVRVIAHQRGQIKRNGEAAAAAGHQVFVTLVGFLRRSKAGKLAHGP